MLGLGVGPYLSEWRQDISTLLPRELIESAADSGVLVRPPRPGVQYKAMVDSSGGTSDSFTAAVASLDGDVAVLDCLVEIKAPFNPDDATAQISAVLKSYGIMSICSDRYAAQWPVAAFDRHDIKVEASERDRSKIYCDVVPLFSSGRVRLIDNPQLVSQFASLERRTFAGGRDRVDHPQRRGGGGASHDDCANAAAGALVLATEKGGYDSSLSWVFGPEGEPKEQDKPEGPSLWNHPSMPLGGFGWW